MHPSQSLDKKKPLESHLCLCLRFVPITTRGSAHLIPMLKRLNLTDVDDGSKLVRDCISAFLVTETLKLLDQLGSTVLNIAKVDFDY